MADFETEFTASRGMRAPQADGNDFEQEFTAHRQNQFEEQGRLRASVFVATQTTPDKAAMQRRLSTATGLPLEVVQSNEGQAQALAKYREIAELSVTSPVLRAKLQNPEFAAIAHDDSSVLASIEQMLSPFSSKPTSNPEAEFAHQLGQGRASYGRIGETYRRPSGQIRAEERGFIAGFTEPIRRGLATGDRGLTITLAELGVLTDLNSLGVRLAEQQRQVERFAVPPEIERGIQAISNASAFGEAFRQILRNPRAALEVSLQSLGSSVPVLTAAVAGSTAGPLGTAAGAGAGSFLTEYSNSLQEVLADRGVDGRDPAAIAAALGNQEMMAAARDKAVKRGIPIALFDALTAGVAGRLLAGAKPTVGSVAVRSLGELGVQGGGGAAGEATAQAITGEHRPGDILLEAIAELPSALVEVPANIRHARQRVQMAEASTAALKELMAAVPATGGQILVRRAQ